MKLLNSRVHGVIDYVLDFLFLIAPSVFGLSSTATGICYAVAAVHFVMSLCTKYEYSLFKLIPFPVHGGFELAAAILLVAMPWLAGISSLAVDRNFFVVIGLAVFAVWATTNYGSMAAITRLRKSTDDFPYRKAG